MPNRAAFLPALAALAPVATYALVIRGWSEQWTFALVAAAAGLLLRSSAATARGLAWSAVSSLLSGLVLLPLLGARLSALAACAWLLPVFGSRGASPRGGEPPLEGWLLTLAAAGFVPWARCLSLLAANSVLALTAIVGAAAAGLALGLRLRGYRSSPGAFSPTSAAIVGGAALMAVPHLIRFVGLNRPSAVHLYAPLRCASDALFLLAQPAAFLGVVAALAAFSGGSSRLGAWSAAFAALGPAAAAWLLPRLGATWEATLVGGALLAYGAARRGRSWLPWSGLQSQLLGAAALGGILAAATAGNPFQEIWLNRLNAAYPGGHFVAVAENPWGSFAVYQFSTGFRVLLRDGVVDPNGGLGAMREAQLPLLAKHFQAKRVLLIGTVQPATVQAASAFGAQIDICEPQPLPSAISQALAAGSWRPPAAVQRVQRPGNGYDLIIQEVPPALHAPTAGAMTTAERLRWLSLRLAQGGVLALRLPRSYFDCAGRVIRTASAVFAHSGAYILPGAILLMASDKPIPGGLMGVLPEDLKRADPTLEPFVNSHDLQWELPISSPATDALPLETLDRCLNALPFRSLLTLRCPDS